MGVDGKKLNGFYIVSNTPFTTDAITYANGVGLKLLGINAPKEHSFLDQIKELRLYPITILKRLTKNQVQELIFKRVVLCSDLISNKEILLSIGLKEDEIKAISSDLALLFSHEDLWKFNSLVPSKM